MGRVGSSKDKLIFGKSNKEVEKHYTIEELVTTNSKVVSSVSKLLNESNNGVKFIDCVEGGSNVREEEDNVPNVVYAMIPVEDPKLMANTKPVITRNEATMHFTHWRKLYKLED